MGFDERPTTKHLDLVFPGSLANVTKEIFNETQILFVEKFKTSK